MNGQVTAAEAASSMHRALELHHAGRLQEAEALYREVLQSHPNHPDAHHNLGVLAMQQNRSPTALRHLKAALEAKRAAEEAMQNKTSKEEIAQAEAELATALAQLEAIRKLRHRA